MPNQHPSGRPRHQRKIGTSSIVRWPREGFLNPRLEGRRELTGGFGFRMPESDRSAVEGMAIARDPRSPTGRS
ncbi:MAG: hypothetical protein U1E62_23970 [Alsobacter sp.]